MDELFERDSSNDLVERDYSGEKNIDYLIFGEKKNDQINLLEKRRNAEANYIDFKMNCINCFRNQRNQGSNIKDSAIHCSNFHYIFISLIFLAFSF